MGSFFFFKPGYSQDGLSYKMTCEYAKTIIKTAIQYEFRGLENKRGNILFIKTIIKKEGVEYAVLFIDERFLHRSESFFKRFDKIETFKYRGLECVYISDSVNFDANCFKPSKMNKELYQEKIHERKVEISKIENAIEPTYCPQIYMYRYWLEKPYGSDRIDL